MRILRTLFILVYALVFDGISGLASEISIQQRAVPSPGGKVRYEAFFTNSLEKRIKVEEFRCREKIFLYFTWHGLQGKHNLKALWYKPDGKIQETTEFQFDTGKGGDWNTWLYLQLEKGNKRSVLSPETEWFHFIGQWTMEIFLDGDFLEKKNFKVTC